MTIATRYQEGCTLDYTPAVAVTAGDIVQLQDGRVGIPANDIAAAALGAVDVEGVYQITKSTSVAFLDGDEVWYNVANQQATYRLNGDIYLGVAIADAAAAVTTVKVDINQLPAYAVELGRTGFLFATTASSGSPTVVYEAGALAIDLDATNEAQRGDALSEDSFALADDWIITGEINVVTDGNNSALDINVGVASATDSDSADDIAESVFVHVDGASANILAESDDGTTEVAATDSTVDLTEGTAFEFKIDGRDPSDVHVYINGVRVLDGTTGDDTTLDISDASGPLKALVHVEKSGGAAAAEVRVTNLKVRRAKAKT